MLELFGALAEFERDIIRERTKAGLAAARAQERIGGRRRVMTAEDLKLARTLIADPSWTRECHRQQDRRLRYAPSKVTRW